MASQCLLTHDDNQRQECPTQLANPARPLIDVANINIQFEIKNKDVLRALVNFGDNRGRIRVRVVTPMNKYLMPPFQITGFEFFSLSEMRHRDFTRDELHNELKRVTTDYDAAIKKSGKFARKAITTRVAPIGLMHNQYPMLLSIGNDFSARHNLPPMRVVNIRVAERGPSVGQEEETGLHFDGQKKARNQNIVRLWIPITATSGKSIDNLLLGVGDISGIKQAAISRDRTFVTEDGLRAVRWYQQKRMTEFDVIFFEGWRVPHFSDNNYRGQKERHDYHNNERYALLVEYTSSPPLHRNIK